VVKLPSVTSLRDVSIDAPGKHSILLADRSWESLTMPSSCLLIGIGTYNFLDTDQIIEKATKMTIPAIFEAEGEEGFRNVESQILDSVHSYVRCVVSTGGGLITRVENWAKLQTGVVVWLDVEPEIIIQRIKGTDRPLLQCDDPLQKLKDLLSARKDKYSQADLRIEVGEDMDEAAVADMVVRELHRLIDENPPAWKIAKAKAQAEGLDWVK
jgi:shikimate kinase